MGKVFFSLKVELFSMRKHFRFDQCDNYSIMKNQLLMRFVTLSGVER